MNKSKKNKKGNIERYGSEEPPITERDLETGNYLKNKREALNEWFRNAKRRASSKGQYTAMIDPKQLSSHRK